MICAKLSCPWTQYRYVSLFQEPFFPFNFIILKKLAVMFLIRNQEKKKRYIRETPWSTVLSLILGFSPLTMVIIVSHFLFLDVFWSISCGDVLIINLIIRRDYKNINLLLVNDILWSLPHIGRYGLDCTLKKGGMGLDFIF
jgi:hypothetical protein